MKSFLLTILIGFSSLSQAKDLRLQGAFNRDALRASLQYSEAPERCEEFPVARTAEASISIYKLTATRMENGYKFQRELVCKKSLTFNVIDRDGPGRCWRGQGVECLTQNGADQLRVGVTIQGALETAPYPDFESPKQKTKSMGAGVYVMDADGTYTDFQNFAYGLVSTSELALGKLALEITPNTTLCRLVSDGNGGTKTECTTRPVSYEAIVGIEDRP